MNMNLDNNIKTIVIIALALYSGAVAPSLPNSIIKFFDTIFGKLLFIFLIAYIANRDAQISIMVALAFMVTLTLLNRRNVETLSLSKEGMFFSIGGGDGRDEGKGCPPDTICD